MKKIINETVLFHFVICILQKIKDPISSSAYYVPEVDFEKDDDDDEDLEASEFDDLNRR